MCWRIENAHSNVLFDLVTDSERRIVLFTMMFVFALLKKSVNAAFFLHTSNPFSHKYDT